MDNLKATKLALRLITNDTVRKYCGLDQNPLSVEGEAGLVNDLIDKIKEIDVRNKKRESYRVLDKVI